MPIHIKKEEIPLNNIYLFVGKSGTGKNTLVEALAEKYGLKVLQSYTTRKPRCPGETGHIFIDEQFYKQSMGEIVAYTFFDDNHYFCTQDQVNAADLYIVDPLGIEYFKSHYQGDKGIKIVYCYCKDEERVKKMRDRGDSDEKIERRLVIDEKMFDHDWLMEIADVHIDTYLNSNVETITSLLWFYISMMETSLREGEVV